MIDGFGDRGGEHGDAGMYLKPPNINGTIRNSNSDGKNDDVDINKCIVKYTSTLIYNVISMTN
jgi:hypothetical protein